MDRKNARWLSGGALALTLLTTSLIAGQGPAMASATAQETVTASAEVCGSQYGTFVHSVHYVPGGGPLVNDYIQGDDGLLYHRQYFLEGNGNSSFSGLSNGDRVRFDYARNPYGGGGPTNICRVGCGLHPQGGSWAEGHFGTVNGQIHVCKDGKIVRWS